MYTPASNAAFKGDLEVSMMIFAPACFIVPGLFGRRGPCPFNFLSNTGRGIGTVVSRSDMDGRLSSER